MKWNDYIPEFPRVQLILQQDAPKNGNEVNAFQSVCQQGMWYNATIHFC